MSDSQARKMPTLTILVGTVDRIDLLKACLNQLFTQLRPDYQVFVIDAGSTDGTQAYVRSLNHPQLQLVEDGKKLGQARSFNQVLRRIESKYVCWISDDNIVTDRALDVAVNVLDQEPKIGMVGLKVKDINGRFQSAPYIGGIWESGILNINQGMLRMDLFRSLGFFDETFGSYGIDAALTTQILLQGYEVCMTKQVAILHNRMHASHPGAFTAPERTHQQAHSKEIYLEKYVSLCGPKTLGWMATLFVRVLARLEYFKVSRKYNWFVNKFIRPYSQVTVRDWRNALTARWISPYDLFINRDKSYYLVQRLPERYLEQNDQHPTTLMRLNQQR